MTEFILATHNPRKLAEVASILAGYGHTVAATTGVLPQEGDQSLVANALAKAQAVHVASPTHWVLGDDSGLFLHAQPERLGVRTARDLPAVGTNQALLALVADDRQVTLRSAMVLLGPDGQAHEAIGELAATLATSERGSNSRGFDKLLIPDGVGLTLAEMTAATRLPYLPRQRALAQLLL